MKKKIRVKTRMKIIRNITEVMKERKMQGKMAEKTVSSTTSERQLERILMTVVKWEVVEACGVLQGQLGAASDAASDHHRQVVLHHGEVHSLPPHHYRASHLS